MHMLYPTLIVMPAPCKVLSMVYAMELTMGWLSRLLQKLEVNKYERGFRWKIEDYIKKNTRPSFFTRLTGHKRVTMKQKVKDFKKNYGVK